MAGPWLVSWWLWRDSGAHHHSTCSTNLPILLQGSGTLEFILTIALASCLIACPVNEKSSDEMSELQIKTACNKDGRLLPWRSKWQNLSERKINLCCVQIWDCLLLQHNITYFFSNIWCVLDTHPFKLQLFTGYMTLGPSFPLWASVPSSKKWEWLHSLYRLIAKTEYYNPWFIIGHKQILFIALPLPWRRCEKARTLTWRISSFIHGTKWDGQCDIPAGGKWRSLRIGWKWSWSLYSSFLTGGF